MPDETNDTAADVARRQRIAAFVLRVNAAIDAEVAREKEHARTFCAVTRCRGCDDCRQP